VSAGFAVRSPRSASSRAPSDRRLDLLDVPGGGMVVVDIDAFDGSLYDDFVKIAAPVVSSLSFATK
jgi:hypothetical protein